MSSLEKYTDKELFQILDSDVEKKNDHRCDGGGQQ